MAPIMLFDKIVSLTVRSFRDKLYLVGFPTDMHLDSRSKWVGEPDYHLPVLVVIYNCFAPGQQPHRQPAEQPERQPGQKLERQAGQQPERKPGQQPEREPGQQPDKLHFNLVADNNMLLIPC